jgi:hypothetical protein
MAPVNPKKVAAILAAVLQHSSETDVQPVQAASASAAQSAPPALPSFWGWAGRQDAMRDRVLWQQRHSRAW